MDRFSKFCGPASFTSSTGPQIVDSRKYVNEEITVNQYTLKMHLTIRDLKYDDFTSYKCTAKNSLGEVQGSIKLYGKLQLHFINSRQGETKW